MHKETTDQMESNRTTDQQESLGLGDGVRLAAAGSGDGVRSAAAGSGDGVRSAAAGSGGRGPVGCCWVWGRGPVGCCWVWGRSPVGYCWVWGRGPVGYCWVWGRGPVGYCWVWGRGPVGYCWVHWRRYGSVQSIFFINRIFTAFFPCNVHRVNVKISHSRGHGARGAPPPRSAAYGCVWGTGSGRLLLDLGTEQRLEYQLLTLNKKISYVCFD